MQLLAAWTHNLLDGLLQCGLNFFPAFFCKKVTAEKHSITNSIYKEVGTSKLEEYAKGSTLHPSSNTGRHEHIEERQFWHHSDPHNQWRAFMILLPCLKYPAAQMKWGQKAVAAQSLTRQMQQRNHRQSGGAGQTLPSRRFPCPEIGPRGGAYLLHDWRHHCNLLCWEPALSPVAGNPVAKGCTAGDQHQAKYVIQPHRPVCQ